MLSRIPSRFCNDIPHSRRGHCDGVRVSCRGRDQYVMLSATELTRHVEVSYLVYQLVTAHIGGQLHIVPTCGAAGGVSNCGRWTSLHEMNSQDIFLDERIPFSVPSLWQNR